MQFVFRMPLYPTVKDNDGKLPKPLLPSYHRAVFRLQFFQVILDVSILFCNTYTLMVSFKHDFFPAVAVYHSRPL